MFSRKKNDGKSHPNTVSNVTITIGAAVEAECQMRWYQSTNPQLFEYIRKKYWLSTTGTQQKKTVMQLMMNRKEIHWDKWSPEIRARLGAWLLDLVGDTTGWFEKTHDWSGKKSTTLVVPSEAYLAIQERLMDEAELFAPLEYPMLIEPNDWTNDRAGGYLLNEVMVGNDLVRRGNDSLRQPEIPLNFLNKLQKVAYRINPFIIKIANILNEKGHKIGKFKPLSYASNWEMPSPPCDIDTNVEARKRYREDKTSAENARRKYIRSLHVKTSATLEVANKFKDKDQFYLPWSFDYRGRAYPIPCYLTPHDTDFGKSLIRAAEESVMTTEGVDWLAFQVATTYGLDKAPMKERLEWTKSNHQLITIIAEDPLGNLSEWENVDEPWQFLAACEEYYACVIKKTRSTTGLFVAVDATCSGLQILAGLARDAGTAKLVNVLPSDRPQDAYKTVLEAMENIPPRLKPYCDRGTAKRSVMTIPYNATLQSSKDYIKDAIHKNMPKGPDDKVPKDMQVTPDEAVTMAKSLRDALNKIAPGCLAVRDWIGKEMAGVIRDGAEILEWTTPSGFKVHQKRDKFKTKRLNMHLWGRTQFSIADENLGACPRKHRTSGAPNLIHSLDASLLHLTFQRFDVPFSVIHDSVLCRCTDMTTLNKLVRETYMNMFAETNYLQDFADQIGAKSDPPIIGDLHPESVIESTYFFC